MAKHGGAAHSPAGDPRHEASTTMGTEPCLGFLRGTQPLYVCMKRSRRASCQTGQCERPPGLPE